VGAENRALTLHKPQHPCAITRITGTNYDAPASGCFGVLKNQDKKKRVGYHPDPRNPRPLNHHDERSYHDVTKS
jgi:hypothetical protein